jgi:hypothetical protein
MQADRKIKREVILELLRQNAAMRKLIEDWPPREIMMDYEKEWNEQRLEFLRVSPPIDFKLPGD